VKIRSSAFRIFLAVSDYTWRGRVETGRRVRPIRQNTACLRRQLRGSRGVVSWRSVLVVHS